MGNSTYLKRFSAPDLSISSLLISMFSFDLFDWSFPLHVAALGSDPCKVSVLVCVATATLRHRQPWSANMIHEHKIGHISNNHIFIVFGNNSVIVCLFLMIKNRALYLSNFASNNYLIA